MRIMTTKQRLLAVLLWSNASPMHRPLAFTCRRTLFRNCPPCGVIVMPITRIPVRKPWLSILENTMTVTVSNSTRVPVAVGRRPCTNRKKRVSFMIPGWMDGFIILWRGVVPELVPKVVVTLSWRNLCDRSIKTITRVVVVEWDRCQVCLRINGAAKRSMFVRRATRNGMNYWHAPRPCCSCTETARKIYN